MFIDIASNHCLALQRSAVYWWNESVESFISLRWSEEAYRLEESINIRSLRDEAILSEALSIELADWRVVVVHFPNASPPRKFSRR